MSHLGETHPMRPSEPKGRLSTTYAEAIYMLARVWDSESVEKKAAAAATLAVIFDRDVTAVILDLERGMVS